MAETENQQVQAEQATEQTQQPAAGLTLQDLIVVAQIIQLSSSRGAFRAEELQQVGTLYNKLIGFLETTGALTRAAGEETAEAAPETENA